MARQYVEHGRDVGGDAAFEIIPMPATHRRIESRDLKMLFYVECKAVHNQTSFRSEDSIGGSMRPNRLRVGINMDTVEA
jgi:hypothetical protein